MELKGNKKQWEVREVNNKELRKEKGKKGKDGSKNEDDKAKKSRMESKRRKGN